jgi:hypothetical protein
MGRSPHRTSLLLTTSHSTYLCILSYVATSSGHLQGRHIQGTTSTFNIYAHIHPMCRPARSPHTGDDVSNSGTLNKLNHTTGTVQVRRRSCWDRMAPLRTSLCRRSSVVISHYVHLSISHMYGMYRMYKKCTVCTCSRSSVVDETRPIRAS